MFRACCKQRILLRCEKVRWRSLERAGLPVLEKPWSPSGSLPSLQGGGHSCFPGSCHCLRALRRGVPANLELLAENSALLGRTGSVLGNLLLPWRVTSWGTGEPGRGPLLPPLLVS